MPGLICPISAETIDKRASRLCATLTALLLVGYAVTGAWPILIAVVVDYSLRVLTPYRAPLSILSGWLVRLTGFAPKRMNKGRRSSGGGSVTSWL